MATYYKLECGHYTVADPWKTGPDISVRGYCPACKQARIGQVIEFARFGKPPVSGASRNHREQVAESGVSVYEIICGRIDFCGWYVEIAQRPAYRGKGRIVGFGSDGEPLVEIISIKRDRNLDQA